MAIRKEFGFPSRDGINTCHAYSWSPDDGNIRAIFQIVHGMEEYMDRYDDFASFMAGHGFLVVGEDHLGQQRRTLGILPSTMPRQFLSATFTVSRK